MSQRMLDAILSVKEFAHQTYPIQVNYGSAATEDSDFVGVHLLSHQDYFDWEKSVYKKGGADGLAKSVREFILTVPEDEFPPIFRLSAAPTRLFISDDARQVLKNAGIRGPAYIPLDFYKRVDLPEVDVPVVIPTRS